MHVRLCSRLVRRARWRGGAAARCDVAGAIGGGLAGPRAASLARVRVSDVTRTHRNTRSSSMLPINFTVPYHLLALAIIVKCNTAFHKDVYNALTIDKNLASN